MKELKKRQSSRRLLDLGDSSGMMAELRNVVVMFIKIDMPSMEIVIDMHTRQNMLAAPRLKPSHHAENDSLQKLLFRKNILMDDGGSQFLSKSVNEKVADQLLLDKLQACFECLIESFNKHEGQMRQFIVDDKGTVCIGTFGLRGSVRDDNAAAAIETAHMIVTKLQEIGITSSIGITVGKAYCGEVGSENRHEYAVMGPSINLSARLMCKALPGGILCDTETMKSDRTHDFETLACVVAKGYVEPVGTFRPCFGSECVTGIEEILHSQDNKSCKSSLFSSKNTFKSTYITSEFREHESSKQNPCSVRKAPWEEMLKASFYLPATVNKSDSNEVTTRKLVRLHGRTIEIEHIITFLFDSLVEQQQPIKTMQPLVNITAQDSSNKVAHIRRLSIAEENQARNGMFSTETSVRVVGVFGNQGLGKGALIGSIAQHINSFCMKQARFNVQVFKCRSANSYTNATPFIAWKPVIQDMLIRIYRTMCFPTTDVGSNSKRKRRKSFVGASSGLSEIQGGVKCIMPLLNEELQSYVPLLGFLSIVPAEDVEVATKLNPSFMQDKVMCVQQLLVAIVQQYSKVSQRVVFLTIENIDYFDAESLALLQSLYTQKVTGILILFSGRPNQGTSSIFVDPPQQRLQGKPNVDKLNTIEGDCRYLQMEITELSKAATVLMVQDIVTNSVFDDFQTLDENALDRIFEASKGHPIYTKELTRLALVDQSTGKTASLSVENSSLAEGVLQNKRIEDIICHRFDQLYTAAQTVLKIAAVANSSGAPFTFEMLAFILNDDNFGVGNDMEQGNFAFIVENLTEMNLSKALYDIVQLEDFLSVNVLNKTISRSSSTSSADIEIKRNSNSPKAKLAQAIEDSKKLDDFLEEQLPRHEVTREQIAANEYSFEFHISLELMTIKNLLLEDQKQVIHECVAEYYQSMRNKMGDNNEETITQYAREAYHWQSAYEWNSAMYCRYQCALLEKNEYLRSMQYSIAYTLYTQMKVNNLQLHNSEDDVTIGSRSIVTGALSVEFMSKMELTALIHTTMRVDDKQQQRDNLTALAEGTYDLHYVQQKPSSVQSIEYVHAIYAGNSELLHIGVLIQLKEIQKSLYEFKSFHKTQILIEDCLQQILLTKSPLLLCSSASDCLSDFNGGLQMAPRNDSEDEAGCDLDDYFQLKEFQSAFFSALSAYVQNYLNSVKVSEEQDEKSQLVCELFVFKSEKQDVNIIHKIQAMLLQVDLFFKTNQIQEGLVVFSELQKVHHAHSTELVTIYGCDRMPLLFAQAAQFMLRQCNLEAALQLIDSSVELITNQRHLITIYMSIIPVCCVLVLLRRYQEAQSVFKTFLSVKVRVTYQADPTVDDIHQVYGEWLARLVKYHCEYAKSKDHSVFADDSGDIDLILQQGGVSQYSEGGDKSVFYDYLSMHSRSVESVFVEMCAIKIAVMIDEGRAATETTDFKLYSKSSLMYIKHILSVNADHTSQLLFNQTCTLITASQIYDLISKHQAKFRMTSTVQAECRHIVKMLASRWIVTGEESRQQEMCYFPCIALGVFSHIINYENGDKKQILLTTESLCRIRLQIGDVQYNDISQLVISHTPIAADMFKSTQLNK